MLTKQKNKKEQRYIEGVKWAKDFVWYVINMCGMSKRNLRSPNHFCCYMKTSSSWTGGNEGKSEPCWLRFFSYFITFTFLTFQSIAFRQNQIHDQNKSTRYRNKTHENILALEESKSKTKKNYLFQNMSISYYFFVLLITF